MVLSSGFLTWERFPKLSQFSDDKFNQAFPRGLDT